MQVARRAGRAQIAGGGEDRVDRVVRVGVAGVERVDAVLDPGGRHELHPADGACGRDRLVGAVVGLDLVDRGEDLPRARRTAPRRPGRSAAGTAGCDRRTAPAPRPPSRRVRRRALPLGRRSPVARRRRCCWPAPAPGWESPRSASSWSMSSVSIRSLSGGAGARPRGLSPTVSWAPSLRRAASFRPDRSTWAPARGCSRC